MQSSMTRRDAEHLVSIVRAQILTLFPDSEETYEVVYARRFSRLIDEFTTPSADHQGVVLPFPERSR